jgi:hypothetical protein
VPLFNQLPQDKQQAPLIDDSFITVQLELDMPIPIPNIRPQSPRPNPARPINITEPRPAQPPETKQLDSQYLLPMSVIETSTNGSITSFLLDEYKNSSCFSGGHIARNLSYNDNPFMAFTLAKKAAHMFDSRLGISTVDSGDFACKYVCLYDSANDSNKVFTIDNKMTDNLGTRIKSIYEDYCRRFVK